MIGPENKYVDNLHNHKRTHKTIETKNDTNFDCIPTKKIKPNSILNFPPSNNFYSTIQEIPSIQLTDNQMNSDPIPLFIQLQEKYKKYGGVKLIASEGWNPPFTFKYIDKGITTRIQNLHKLKHGKAFEQKVEEYSLKNFEGMARNFQKKYQMRTNPCGSTRLSKLQMEYWSLVSDSKCNDVINKDETNSKKDVIVEYAADLPTAKYGSGFPTFKLHNWSDPSFQYETNLFNLNNLFKSPQSILSMSQNRKQKISGITQPWIYMGMQFSTFCWHVEDLWLNSLNYNHKGGVKTWYFIPESDKQKFESYVNTKHQNNTKKKNLLTRITFMEDPQQLINNGIKVYKAYQHPREYICTFFKAYHCGFSQGFNIGEAVNFATAKSISYMLQAQKWNQKNQINKPSVIPMEWLLYQNVERAYQFTQNSQIIISTYNKIIKKQYQNIRTLFKNNIDIKAIKLVKRNAKYDKHSCSKCKNYLYLSFLECLQCNKKFCFKHLEECDHKNYQFFIRQPNQIRKKLLEMFPLIAQSLNSSSNTYIDSNLYPN